MAKDISNIFQRRILRSLGFSLKGIQATFKEEEAFRVEVILAFFLVPIGLFWGETEIEKILLVGSVLLVLLVEIVNSAIESIIDRFGGEQHELSGRAKDQGSAAVLLALFFVVLVWGVLLFPKKDTELAPVTASGHHLTILGTADLQGKLEPVKSSIDLEGNGKNIDVVGGISRIASLIKSISSEKDRSVIMVSAGDDLMGRYFSNFHGHAITGLLAESGYDVFALGNHEFDFGPDVLRKALSNTTLNTLCSDLDVEGTAIASECSKSYIKEYDGVRVGLFSLMTPEFPYVSDGGTVSLRGSATEIAKEMVQSLKQQNVDLIVAVTHIGIDLDRKLAADVDGIDIVFGGHSHEYLREMEIINETLIVNGGEKGTALVRIDVLLDKDKKLVVDSTKYTLLPVLESIPEDSATAQKLKNFTDQFPATIVLGSTDREWRLHKENLRMQESAVADMLNDLILEKFEVDLVLNNSGALRGNRSYPAGPVTDTMLHEIDEFENVIYLVKMKGQYIREIFEHSAALQGHGGFLQIAGARIEIDSSKTPQEVTKNNGKWQLTTPGEQVQSIKIKKDDGTYEPLNPEKMYSVATNTFLAEHEGDQYFWFKKYGKDKKDTYTTLYSILAMEINRTKVLNPPLVDGRIRFLVKGALNN